VVVHLPYAFLLTARGLGSMEAGYGMRDREGQGDCIWAVWSASGCLLCPHRPCGQSLAPSFAVWGTVISPLVWCVAEHLSSWSLPCLTWPPAHLSPHILASDQTPTESHLECWEPPAFNCCCSVDVIVTVLTMGVYALILLLGQGLLTECRKPSGV
jgi:hypothetical protein